MTGMPINFTLSTVDNPLSSDRIGGQTMISADLGKQLENFITSLVATGRYNSKSEVLREGVRLIQDRETRLAALDASIARGLADVDAGRTTPADQVFDRLAAKYRAMSAGDE
jgi:antitoxin ParD1/3/4